MKVCTSTACTNTYAFYNPSPDIYKSINSPVHVFPRVKLQIINDKI